jgi:hypothetical protein
MLKGKPTERLGRKAMGLKLEAMIARLQVIRMLAASFILWFFLV